MSTHANFTLLTTIVIKAILVCLFLGTFSVVAQQTEISLEQAEQLALDSDPDIQAFLTRAEAYKHLADAAAELPDLQVRSGLVNYPLEHGNFRTEGMTHTVVGVRQSIPPRGFRSALYTKNEHLAIEQEIKSTIQALEIKHKVRNAWLDAHYRERMLELVRESQTLLGDLLHLARTQYSTGDGNKSDILQIELEQFKVEDRILEAEQERDHAYISLGEYIGHEHSIRHKVSNTLPVWSTIPPLEQLRPVLTSHPKMIALSALADATEAQQQIEESGLNRKWMFDLSYAYRDGGLLSSASRSDLISATVSFNLPIWGKQKYQQKIAHVAKLHNATLLEQQSTLRELEAKLETAHAHWTTLNARVALYEDQIIPKAKEHAEVTLESYENQANDLSVVVQSHISQIEAELKHLQLTINRLKAWADIDKLVSQENL